MFGEGRHPNIKEIYDAKLAPFLTQASSNFWDSRLWYFEKGLYYQGGQVCLTSSFLPPFTLKGAVLKSAWLDSPGLRLSSNADILASTVTGSGVSA